MLTVVSTGIIGLSLGVQYALLSLGFTLVFGIMRVVNFAHGGFYLLGGYICYTLNVQLGLPFPLAVIGATVVSALAGYVIEVILIDKHVNNMLFTMIITLGLFLVMVTGVIILYGPEPMPFRFPLRGALNLWGVRVPYSNFAIALISIVVIGALYVLLYGTRFGIALRAMADDSHIAITQGINPRYMFPLAFGLSTGLAGITGAMVTPVLSLEPTVGEPALITSFIIVILGGIGSLNGALIASIGVGMVESYAGVYLGGSRGALLLYSLVAIILLFRPQGLAGVKEREA